MSDIQSTGFPPDDHLSRLLPSTVEEPWYRSLFENIRDAVNPPKLPPLELTSKPVAVKSIWGMYRPDERNFGLSALVVIGVVVLLGTVFSVKAVRDAMKPQVTALIDPVAPFVPAAKVKKTVMGGGGGGGDRSPTPASKGKLPKIAMKQFVPPSVTPPPQAKLVMVPTIVAPPDAPIPNVNSPNIGDPLSRIAAASNGVGSGGGIGSGSRGGIGSGSGAGFGPGHGGGFGDGAFRVGGGVSAPEILSKVDPEYSEEARKAKFSGTVLLRIVVDAAGRVSEAKVIRGIGLGLDEKAIEAVNKWKFKPGVKNGAPVPVVASIEVNFRLL
jgi:TonB family protein